MGLFSRKSEGSASSGSSYAQVPVTPHKECMNGGPQCVEMYSKSQPYDSNNYNPSTGKYENEPPRSR